jgi:hypothetical protein
VPDAESAHDFPKVDVPLMRLRVGMIRCQSGKRLTNYYSRGI